jgi:hypothetical protein
VAAGVQLRQPQRGLVRLAAGRQEHRARQRRRQHRHQLARELGHVARQEAAEQVHDARRGVAHRVADRGMAVAERRAHLARGEVEYPAPVGGLEPAPFGALDQDVGELAGVADQLIGDRRGGGGGGDGHV